jgi:hypothetical protein
MRILLFLLSLTACTGDSCVRGGVIAGHVVLGGFALADQTVTASSGSEAPVTTTTDENGVFEMVLPNADGWVLSVSGFQPLSNDALCSTDFQGSEPLCAEYTVIEAEDEGTICE